MSNIDAPWLDEPTDIAFEHAGLQCVMHRKDTLFHWCGYIGIPKDHPLFGVGRSEESPVLGAALEQRLEHPVGESPSFAVLMSLLGGSIGGSPGVVFEVHGGITWDGPYPGGHPEREAEGLWWYGFDCAHAGDLSPRYALAAIGDFPGHQWRDQNYARRQTERLAEQLAAITPLGADKR